MPRFWVLLEQRYQTSWPKGVFRHPLSRMRAGQGLKMRPDVNSLLGVSNPSFLVKRLFPSTMSFFLFLLETNGLGETVGLHSKDKSLCGFPEPDLLRSWMQDQPDGCSGAAAVFSSFLHLKQNDKLCFFLPPNNEVRLPLEFQISGWFCSCANPSVPSTGENPDYLQRVRWNRSKFTRVSFAPKPLPSVCV